MTNAENGQRPNPIDALVQNTRPGQEPDYFDANVRAAIVDAITKLGFCDDTMALLVDRTGLAKGQSYQDIRKQFPDGSQDED